MKRNKEVGDMNYLGVSMVETKLEGGANESWLSVVILVPFSESLLGVAVILSDGRALSLVEIKRLTLPNEWRSLGGWDVFWFSSFVLGPCKLSCALISVGVLAIIRAAGAVWRQRRVKHTMRVLEGLIWSSDANIKSSDDWIPSCPLLHFTSRVEKGGERPVFF